MSYSFSQVPTADIPRSSFNRTHGHKTTFNSGYLIPFYVDEALPGDTFKLSAHLFARLATPIVPIMDNMFMDVFFFAVPNRLLWENWQRFMGERPAPNDSIDFTVPEVVSQGAGFAPLSIYDYMGVPVGVPNLRIGALWNRAYALIWNEWFRDENLQDPIAVPVDDGPDLHTFYELKRRGKRHDYFTSCLPWPQKGEGVELPLGQTAPVVGGGTYTPTFRPNGLGADLPLAVDSTTTADNVRLPGSSNDGNLVWGTGSIGLVADLSSATVATINSLRQAFQIQKLLERDARGGTRYTEILRSHFGVVSPDARLQRPEYLGGGSTPVVINPVAQTSNSSATPTEGVTPQGNLAAYGLVGGKGMGFTKSFVEHSVIIGLVMVRADLSYQQGLPRMFSRRTRYDFYWPAFSHLGEQAVLNQEIYATGVGTPPDGTIPGTGDYAAFGYQERWAEYRYFPSKITGAFRSNYPAGTDPDTSLDFWHLAQNFPALPVLGASFIEENPPIDRVIAVKTEPEFLFDSHIAIQSVRPMPTYSVPGLVDHF